MYMRLTYLQFYQISFGLTKNINLYFIKIIYSVFKKFKYYCIQNFLLYVIKCI